MRRSHLCLCLALGAPLVLACGGPAFEPLSSLTAALPLAEVRREVPRLDLGTPEARAFLGAGWSPDAVELGRFRCRARTFRRLAKATIARSQQLG